MTMEGVDPAQLRALRDLAQLRKDRDLAVFSQARAVVQGIESRLATLDAAVAAAKAGVSAAPDPASLSTLDAYVRTARVRREGLNTELARARALADQAQQQAVRATGQVEVLDQMQDMQSEELRLALARRDQI